MKQKLVTQKGEMNKSTIMVSTLLAPSQKLNTTVGQKITKDLMTHLGHSAIIK